MMSEALLLRALRGAPLSCLLALALIRRPSGSGWLVASTGYHKDSVADALRLLEQLGLAQNEGRYNGWRLTAGAWQLSLFGGPPGTTAALSPGDGCPGEATPSRAGEEGAVEGAGRAVPPSLPGQPEAERARIPLSEGDILALLRGSSSGGGLTNLLSRESREPPPLPESGKAEKSPSGGQPLALPPEAQSVAICWWSALPARAPAPTGRSPRRGLRTTTRRTSRCKSFTGGPMCASTAGTSSARVTSSPARSNAARRRPTG